MEPDPRLGLIVLIALGVKSVSLGAQVRLEAGPKHREVCRELVHGWLLKVGRRGHGGLSESRVEAGALVHRFALSSVPEFAVVVKGLLLGKGRRRRRV